MLVLFAATVSMMVVITICQKLTVNYVYDGKIGINISFLIFTLHLYNLGEKRKKTKLLKRIKAFPSFKDSTKYIISHSKISLDTAYSNDSNSPFAKAAIKNYGINTAIISFLVSYLKNNAESFSVDNGAVRLTSLSEIPDSRRFELTQNITLIHVLIALLIFARKKIKV